MGEAKEREKGPSAGQPERGVSGRKGANTRRKRKHPIRCRGGRGERFKIKSEGHF